MQVDEVRRLELAAMSCNATVLVRGGDASLPAIAAERIADLEQSWSRFRDDSEISNLNRSGGMPVRCSDDTVVLVEALVQAWHATEGAFDPTMLGAIVDLGYGTSRAGVGSTRLPSHTAPRGRPDLVCVDRNAGVVQLPTATAIDPGGIGKGLAADLVASELVAAGALGAMIEIGGDLRVAGEGPDDGAWTIAVGHPLDGDPEFVRLLAGGVATSSCRRRTWRADGDDRHHLLDPSTLRPTGGDTVGCTVIAGTAAWAEAFTKVAFVRDSERAIDMYERLDLAARVVMATGRNRTTSAWKRFER